LFSDEHNGIHPASSNPSNQLFVIFRDVKIQSAKATPLQAVSDKGLNIQPFFKKLELAVMKLKLTVIVTL